MAGDLEGGGGGVGVPIVVGAEVGSDAAIKRVSAS